MTTRKVFVYYNLHSKCWSIKSLSGKNKGRVIAHASKVIIRDAEFSVSEAGRQRVLKNKCKNVHAGIVGTLESYHGDAVAKYDPYGINSLCSRFDGEDRAYQKYAKAEGKAVSYNPYKGSHFVEIDTSEPIHKSDMVYLNKTGREVRAFNPCEMPV